MALVPIETETSGNNVVQIDSVSITETDFAKEKPKVAEPFTVYGLSSPRRMWCSTSVSDPRSNPTSVLYTGSAHAYPSTAKPGTFEYGWISQLLDETSDVVVGPR